MSKKGSNPSPPAGVVKPPAPPSPPRVRELPPNAVQGPRITRDCTGCGHLKLAQRAGDDYSCRYFGGFRSITIYTYLTTIVPTPEWCPFSYRVPMPEPESSGD